MFNFVALEVFTVILAQMEIWVAALCSNLAVSQRFGGTGPP
jgi:hypothetical protein